MSSKTWKRNKLNVRRETSNGSESFINLWSVIPPKDFERVYDSLKEYNTDISHEVYEGTTIDKDGLVILVAVTIINLDK